MLNNFHDQIFRRNHPSVFNNDRLGNGQNISDKGVSRRNTPPVLDG